MKAQALSADVVRPKQERWRTTLLLLLVLLPAILSFGVLYSQPLSVPYQDDYHAILDFSIRYEHLPSLREKVLDIAAAQHNEYKLGFEHAVVAAELDLQHHLNFGFLVVLGDCFLLGIGYLLWLVFSNKEADVSVRALRFLPISFLVFSLTYWENLNWAMTGLQNTPVIFFSLLALYLLIPARQTLPSGSRMLAACVVAALAAFSSANAFLLGPIGLLFLLPRRSYRRSLMWCACFLAPFAAYLYHYQRQAIHLHKFYYVTRPLFFVAFLGYAVLSKWPALLLGLGLLATFVLAIRSRFDRISPVLTYFAGWITGTALLVAWVRGGTGFGLGSRYSFYSVLLLIFAYSFLGKYLPDRFSGFDQRRFYAISLALACSLWLSADVHAYKCLRARRQMVLSGIELYRAATARNSPMVDPAVEKAFPEEKAFEQKVLTTAIQEGIYALPPESKVHAQHD